MTGFPEALDPLIERYRATNKPDEAKETAQAEQAGVLMAPAADMFEMGVKVQVLERGTMFAMRAAKLYELYRGHAALEKNFFRAPIEQRRCWKAFSPDPFHPASPLHGKGPSPGGRRPQGP